MGTRELQTEYKELFKKPADEVTAYFAEKPLILENVRLERQDISDSTFHDAQFFNTEWIDSRAIESTFINARFHGGSMRRTGFGKSRLVNVIFEDVTFDTVSFVAAELINVTFRNCKIYNSEIRNLNNSNVSIVDSELSNVSFFQSLLQLKIRNSKIVEAIEFMGAQTGSSVDISDSEIGRYSDFGGSNFVSFEIRNTKIDNSSANGITAKKVILDNVVSDFAIADSTVGSVEIKSLSGRFSLGGTKAVSAVIEDCSAQKIYLDEFVADRLSLRKCNIEKFVLDAAIVKDATLANLTVDELVLDSLKAGKLALNNVLINHKLSAQGAMAEEIPAPNWRVAAGAAIEAEGSNIPMPKPGL